MTSLKVLIVDDNEDNLYYLTALLTGSGFTVAAARNGAEALAMARAAPPDLVVSDLLMPVMDGYSLLRAWKAEAALSRAPFIVYTATYTDPEDERLARHLGADAFLVKPVEPQDLLARVQEVLGRGTPPARPDTAPGAAQEQLQHYSQALIRKLEDRTARLEEANQALRSEIAGRHRLAEMQVSILHALPAQVALTDGTGRIVTVNDAWRTAPTPNLPHGQYFGVGDDYPAFCERATDAAIGSMRPIADGLRAVLAGLLARFTLRFACHSGTEQHWYRLMVTPLHKDKTAGAVVMYVDITEQVQVELSLRESEERFRQLAENIREVFWIIDPASRQVLYVSPAYETIWGRSCDSLRQRPEDWLEAIDPEDRRRVQARVARQSAGEEYDETYRIVRPDGSVRWIHDRGFPVRDAAGASYRMVGLAEDITERKRIEAQVLRAQRLDSIGTLAGGIAHDLNNVLTPILLSIEVLKMDERDTQRLDLLAMIERSAQRGADMVGQVLSFARGVEGRRINVSLREVLREVAKIARETFPRSIEIRADIPADLHPITGDPTQLHRVVLNLTVNARDAMPHGGTLTLSARNLVLDARDTGLDPDMQPGAAVVVEVEDTGIGMAADQLPQIFDPFFTTKAPGSGTGLGLSTSLAITKSHGGSLRVYSEPGKGSRFRLCLPAADDVNAEAPLSPASGLPRGGGALVLLVDDDPTVRHVTGRTLEAFGYRVAEATNGAEAVAIFAGRRDEVAIVLTDMMMPVMDGLATIRVLRHMRADVPIIAASGLSVDGRMARATEAGVRHFLQKPYTTETLLNTIAEVLDAPHRGGSRGDGRQPPPAAPAASTW
ncbi:MAG: hypothetical protein BGP12_15375 [Rhodospirillales bacterium 70-18]|nr:MAG: hypothetical protein BGP12_15375 [Rhodospirillales bacterium 70-18]